MANPSIVDVAAADWTKVATNVTLAAIQIMNRKEIPNYLWTYRDTGEAEPTAVTEGSPFPASGRLQVDATVGKDVYVWSLHRAGSVRLDA